MPNFEKAQETLRAASDSVVNFSHNIVEGVRDFKDNLTNRAIGGVAVRSVAGALLLTSVLGGARVADSIASEAPVDDPSIPTLQEAAYEATHPEYLATPGGDYRGNSLTILAVGSIDLPALSSGAAELGDREVDVFAQTQGKKGQWGKYSNTGVIKDDGMNTWQATLTTKRFTPIPGPANRKIRLVTSYSYTPDGSNKPISTKTYPGKPFKYGPGGDGR